MYRIKRKEGEERERERAGPPVRVRVLYNAAYVRLIVQYRFAVLMLNFLRLALCGTAFRVSIRTCRFVRAIAIASNISFVR